MELPSTTAGLCALIAGFKPAQMSDAARSAAARALLDASGVILGASVLSGDVQPFIAMAAGAGGGPCSVLGTLISAPPTLAALANGAMSHALDYEDAFDPATGHPNASLVPALIALAQAAGPISGDHFLAALAIGCEVSCRMALALERPMEAGGWYPPPMLAGIGAAAGAANLLRLDAAQTASAISLMLCQSVMPGEIKHSRQTNIRAIREAFPAQAAVQSVLLAQSGVQGFEAPIEGQAGFYAVFAGGAFNPDILTAPLEGGMRIEQLTFKPWPSCRGTHPFIEMALELRHAHAIAPQQVASITVEIDDVQQMLAQPIERKRAPATLIDAKFSIPFCTALALTRGQVDLDSFTTECLTDPAVLALAASVNAIPARSELRTRGSGGAMTITLRDGTSHSAEIGNAYGCPERPLAEAALVAKFADCAMRAASPLSKDEALAMARQILSLADCKDVGALYRSKTPL